MHIVNKVLWDMLSIARARVNAQKIQNFNFDGTIPSPALYSRCYFINCNRL